MRSPVATRLRHGSYLFLLLLGVHNLAILVTGADGMATLVRVGPLSHWAVELAMQCAVVICYGFRMARRHRLSADDAGVLGLIGAGVFVLPFVVVAPIWFGLGPDRMEPELLLHSVVGSVVQLVVVVICTALGAWWGRPSERT